MRASDERKKLLLKIIAKRKQELKEGKTLDDNLLNRLIIMSYDKGNEWVDDDVLQRNIGGLLTGIFETTGTAAGNRGDAAVHLDVRTRCRNVQIEVSTRGKDSQNLILVIAGNQCIHG